MTRPSGHAGPAVSTPGAQCPGVHRFRFAIAPRGTPPRADALFTVSCAFVLPPRIATAVNPAGESPARASLLTVGAEGGGIVLSAVKKADDRDAVIVRVFNPDSATSRIHLSLTRGLNDAFLVDLLERRQEKVAIDAGSAIVDVGPAQIRTIELVPDTLG